MSRSVTADGSLSHVLGFLVVLRGLCIIFRRWHYRLAGKATLSPQHTAADFKLNVDFPLLGGYNESAKHLY